MAAPTDPLPPVQPIAGQGGAASAESQRDGETKPTTGSRTEMPMTLGRYRVLKKLGGGGMGAVYLVENTELQREEALKVPHFDSNDDPTVRERFLREARSAAKLDHPNLCQVYDVGVLDGIYFLTMRYLKGKTLAEYAGQQQSVRKAVEIVAKLAQALEAAHAKGVIHRDLKPNNIIMCSGTGPTVMDFGLAKQLQQKAEHLTQMGTMLGTPSYMPPEQVKGELDRMGPPSDVYSLGVILFELLTGSLPFKGAMAEVLGKILYAEPPLVSHLRPGLDPQLDAICRKAMAKDAAERYPTMKGFASILINFLKTMPATEGAGPLVAPPTSAPNAVFQANTVAPPRLPEAGPVNVPAHIFEANTMVPPQPPALPWLTAGAGGAAARPVKNKPVSKVAADEAEPAATRYGLGFWALLLGMAAIGGTALWYFAQPILTRIKGHYSSRDNPGQQSTDVLRKDVAQDIDAMLRVALSGKGTMEYVKTHGAARLPVWQAAADKGLPEGQFLLARCRDAGVGVPQNKDEALRLYRQSADQGYAAAQNYLGYAYQHGELGLTKNAEEAVRWYRLAADQDFALAQNNLASCYERGEGGLWQNAMTAMWWYRKSADQGCALSQNSLGVGYFNGDGGLPKSPEEAVVWYRKAADQGYPLAQANLGACYYNGQGGLTKSVEEAVRWFRLAADQGNPMAQNFLGVCYYNGQGGLTRSPEEAVLWYRKAADQGDPSAQYNLGVCYQNGQGGLTKNVDEAVVWYRKAADQGLKEAKTALAKLMK